MSVGLLLLTAAFGWAATMDTHIGYLQMAAQMVLLGGGLGLTTAPATDSIMGVVRPEQAGAGSAINDATRQVGGTLGVAVLGSIYTTLYVHRLDASHILSAAPERARSSPAKAWPKAWASPTTPRPERPPLCATPSVTHSWPGCTPVA